MNRFFTVLAEETSSLTRLGDDRARVVSDELYRNKHLEQTPCVSRAFGAPPYRHRAHRVTCKMKRLQTPVHLAASKTWIMASTLPRVQHARPRCSEAFCPRLCNLSPRPPRGRCALSARCKCYVRPMTLRCEPQSSTQRSHAPVRRRRDRRQRRCADIGDFC